MKTKIDIQKEVISLSKKLPAVSKRKISWAVNELFFDYAYRNKNNSTCSYCGHRWNSIEDLVCPNCKKKLLPYEHKSRTIKDKDYFIELTTCNGYQVVRCYYLKRVCRPLQIQDVFCHEVSQHWISPSGSYNVLNTGLNAMGSWGISDGWLFHKLELRKYHNMRNYQWGPTYPVQSLIDNIYRNGFTGDYHKLHPAYFFHQLLGSTAFETLLKIGRFDIVDNYDTYATKLNLYWKSYKITMKHKYNIENIASWFDHMDMLKYLKMDIMNPRFICPDNFNKEHNRISKLYSKKYDKTQKEISRKRDIENNKRELLRIENDEKLKLEYIVDKKKFSELNLTNGDIEIVVLKNIDDFKIEGDTHEHCVYTNRYWEKKESLIMSARKKDERLETIELSLDNWKVLQCYGHMNQITMYHDDILNLVNNNINLIKKLSRRKTKLQTV